MSTDTGHTDNMLTLILDGDYMFISEHIAAGGCCCPHILRCRVEWDEEHKAWMLKYEGKIISGMGIAGGHQVERTMPPSLRVAWAERVELGKKYEIC